MSPFQRSVDQKGLEPVLGLFVGLENPLSTPVIFRSLMLGLRLSLCRVESVSEGKTAHDTSQSSNNSNEVQYLKVHTVPERGICRASPPDDSKCEPSGVLKG